MSFIPNTIGEIRDMIERNAQEQFMILNVPELFFWELGLEYIGNDTITVEYIGTETLILEVK